MKFTPLIALVALSAYASICTFVNGEKESIRTSGSIQGRSSEVSKPFWAARGRRSTLCGLETLDTSDRNDDVPIWAKFIPGIRGDIQEMGKANIVKREVDPLTWDAFVDLQRDLQYALGRRPDASSYQIPSWLRQLVKKRTTMNTNVDVPFWPARG